VPEKEELVARSAADVRR